MEKKDYLKILVLIILIVIIVLSFVLTRQPRIIGRDKDEHGCLIGAGYSWNEDVGACIREWELNSSQKWAAKISISHLSFYVTITEVQKLDCEGCYKITIQRNDNMEILELKIKNWKLSSDKEKNYCSSESRGAEVCIQIYQPVCGWFNSSIQCVKYPCAATYSNSCVACANPSVEYWIDGECLSA